MPTQAEMTVSSRMISIDDMAASVPVIAAGELPLDDMAASVPVIKI